MAMSTKVEQVDSKEYIKSVIKVNLSTIIIMSWFMISGLLSSYYCVVSAAQMVQLCLVGESKEDGLVGDPSELTKSVPWHDFIRKKDEKSKPETVKQEVTFDAQKILKEFGNVFLFRLKDIIEEFEDSNKAEKKYHNILFIELLSIITKSVEWDCWVISESFEFIHKIAPHGVVLMTSFIILPIFLGMFFILNLFYTIFAWFKSIYGAFTRCGIVDYFDTVLHKTTGNVDPQALSVIGSLFFLFFYAIIMPLLCFITIIPIAIYFLITLWVIPIYSLFLPLKITGELRLNNSPETKKAPFTLGTSMFSNIYTYMNYYSVAFSIVYALVSSILQDAYYFVGCLVAIILIWIATSFYKQEPFMGKSSSSTSEEGNDKIDSSSDDGNTVQLEDNLSSNREVPYSSTKASVEPAIDSDTRKVDLETVVDSDKPKPVIVPSETGDGSTKVDVDSDPAIFPRAEEVESVINSGEGTAMPAANEETDAKLEELKIRLANLKKGGESNKKRNKSKNKRSKQ